jgi:hypothetical protein
MEFMHPGLLAGGLLAALPVVLHLVMRQRPQRLEFPALRFIKARQASNRRTLKLRHLLLLLLRMAAIAALAAALARPSARLFGMLGDAEGPVTAVLVFDTSPRMSYVAERRSRLVAAQEFALQLLDGLPEKSEVGVLETTTGAPVFEADRAIARERIANLKVGGRGLPLAAVCESAVQLLGEAKHGRRELYVFTDLSVGGWSGHRSNEWLRRATDAGVAKVRLIDVGAERPENFALGNLALSDQTLIRNRPLIVSGSVSSVGSAAKRLVRLLTVDRQTQKLVERGRQEVDVAADSSAEVQFTLGSLELGLHQGEMRIDDADNLPEDNVRYFTVEVRPPAKLLVAAPDPPERRAEYFVEAVAGRELRVNGSAPYEVRTVSYEALGREEFDHEAAVVLLDPPELNDAVWQQLETYARGGGGVLVFLGPGAKPQAMNREVPQLMLAGKIGIQARYPNGDLCLFPDADQHPSLVDFRPVKNAVPWEDFPIYRYWKLEPAVGTTLVAAFNNQAPAIVERGIGRGHALTVVTPVSETVDVAEDDRWNLLPTGPRPWPFVVLMNGLTSYLVGRDEALNYFAQETAVVRLDPAKRFETYLVTRRDGDESPLRLPADLKANTLTVPITDRPGNYVAQAGGTDDGVVRGFSVNLPADSDAIRRLDDAQQKALFGDAPYDVTRRFDALKREANPDRSGKELFPLLICFVAVVLGLEHVLANRFYRK